MIKRRLTEKAPHPKELVGDLPKTLDLIVARMLARTPNDRYATAAEVRDLLIPAIALEGGFDDPSWRPPTTRSNPTVYIQAAEQPTQEMTPYPGITAQLPVWKRPGYIGTAVLGVIIVATAATAMARSALESRTQAQRAQRVLEQQANTKPPQVQVMVVPAPKTAPIPSQTGASATARNLDSTSPAPAVTRSAATSNVPQELRAPIEQLRAAIESGLPSKMMEVYKAYEQDDATKKYLKGIIDHADSIRVKSISYQSSNVTGNSAELKYRMIVGVMTNGSKTPVEVPSTWRAVLVREGAKSPWKIQHLTPVKL
jgi:hypothetical protein